MEIIFWILFSLSLLGAAYCTFNSFYLDRFVKNSELTFATVVGFELSKRGKGGYPRVEFRTKYKRFVSTRAMVFDNSTLSIGQKVKIRYLETDNHPQKWDVRIIGTSGYGKKQTKKLIMIGYGISAALFIFACVIRFVL